MVYHGPADSRYEARPDPRMTFTDASVVPDPSAEQLEHANDVILRVTRAAICGSDLHLYRGPGQCNTKRFMPHLLALIREAASNRAD